MNAPATRFPHPTELLGLMLRRPAAWLVPAVLVAALATAYAVLKNDTWEASQALLVRNEAFAAEGAPGKFRQIEDMKTLQETILELARSRAVLHAALAEVGPSPAGRSAPSTWPSDEDVAELRRNVKLRPPKGAEFGKTEVFYVAVRDRDRSRSLALCRAVCKNLDERFQQLRDAKAKSMIDELVKTAAMARTDLDESTARLTEIERGVGSDLTELRGMDDPSAGESSLQRTAAEIRGELRQVRAAIESSRQLNTLLAESRNDPGKLLAAPATLLDSQPALKRLKEGLIDAQLRTASLRGAMSSEHPRVRAAEEAEEEIGRRLLAELDIASRALDSQQRVDQQRLELLEEQLENVETRLTRLAELRATYANLVAENANRRVLAQRAETNLAEARALLAGSRATSLIGRVDGPDVGAKPIGPSRATIVLVGLVGGLAVGVGWIVLSLPASTPTVAGRAAAPVEGAVAVTRSPAAETTDDRGPSKAGNGKPKMIVPAVVGRTVLTAALGRIAAEHSQTPSH